MSNTATATANTENGPVQIEVQIPDANSAAAWNEALKTGAEKAGVDVPGVTEKPVAAAAATGTKKEDDQPTVYRASLTVNGKEMVFEDADPATVLKQYTAAVTASQLAPAPAAQQQTTTEQKPALSAADMFDIGTKLIGGDASGLDTLLEKSGAVGRYLESQGVSIEKLRVATQKTQSDQVLDALTTAKNQFITKVKAGEIDFPGGEQNEKMMGFMLARVQAEDKAAGKDGAFTLDSFEKAYGYMKKEGLVFPVEKKEGSQQSTTVITEKKAAPSSTAIGTSGSDKQTATTQQQVPLANRKFEIDMTKMSTVDANRQWNDLIDQGVKPEQINVIQ